MVTHLQQQQHTVSDGLYLGMNINFEGVMLDIADLGDIAHQLQVDSFSDVRSSNADCRDGSGEDCLVDYGARHGFCMVHNTTWAVGLNWEFSSGVGSLDAFGSAYEDMMVVQSVGETFEEIEDVVSYDLTTEISEGVSSIVGGQDGVVVSSDGCDTIVVSADCIESLGYVPIVACSLWDDSPWGFCYQHLFQDESREEVLGYSEKKPYLTRDHYDWVKENLGFLKFRSKVHAVVYIRKPDGTKRIVHSSLEFDGASIWMALDRLVGHVFSVQVCLHFLPTVYLYRTIDRFLENGGLELILNTTTHMIRFIGVGAFSFRELVSSLGVTFVSSDSFVRLKLYDFGCPVDSVMSLSQVMLAGPKVVMLVTFGYDYRVLWDDLVSLLIYGWKHILVSDSVRASFPGWRKVGYLGF
jgi:hypothetical protein